jgi:nickel-dependent lactate racemase
MDFEIGYGNTVQRFSFPDKNLAGVLVPNPVEMGPKGEAAVEAALDAPIGAPRLEELVKPGQKVAVITSDITRPMPSAQVLPSVLGRLDKAGISRSDITIVFALGSHRRHTRDEMAHLVGEAVLRDYSCVDSSEGEFIHLGFTGGGTPVDIAGVVAKADFRIALGNIEYHYFAGYSGGAKAVMPGCSTYDAIQVNHRRMVEASAHAGKLEGNPVREDIEETMRYCPLHYIVNVVLDEHKKIIKCFAGDWKEAHRAGCRFLDMLYKTYITEPADIVVVSQGGAPKDLNLYQTQKALDNSKHAVREGGVIILVGSCKEGFGNKVFEEWMRQARSPQELVDRIQADFRLGGHKAAAIALVEQKADVYLVSDMAPDTVRDIFMTPFPTVQEALDTAFARMGADARVLVMPYGGSTLPVRDAQGVPNLGV